jgi:hypothetical protein
MPTNWENIKKTVKDELSETATSAKKYFRIGKVKLDLMNMNNSLNDAFREMGVEVYNQINEEIKGDIRHNTKVKSLVDKVNQLKQFIKDKEMKIEVINKESVPSTHTVKVADKPLGAKTKK